MNINQTLKNFPNPSILLKRLTTYSIMDAIMNTDAEYDVSVYHCNTDWNNGVALFTVDDGGGDVFHILFSENSCIVKGFGHESDLSPYNQHNNDDYPIYRFYENAPAEFLELLGDESLEHDAVTFCAWHTAAKNAWQSPNISVPDNLSDGSADFLEYVSGLDEYLSWFKEYYETEVNAELVDVIYGGAPVTEIIIGQINPAIDTHTALLHVNDIKRATVF